MTDDEAIIWLPQTEPGDWIAHLDPIGCVRWEPPKGAVPNAFRRFMQRVCFGIRWERR